MLGESDEFSEILKTGFPVYLLIAIPLLLVLSPVCPANAAHEFSVYRAQQYSLQGTTYGKVMFLGITSPCFLLNVILLYYLLIIMFLLFLS